MRVVKSTDYETISKIISQSPAISRPPSPEKLERIKATFFLAYIENSVAGVVGIHKIQFYMSSLKYLYVNEDYRRQGVARALIEEAINYAEKDYSTPVIIATAKPSNYPCIALLRRYRFRVTGGFESPLSGTELVLMTRVGESSLAEDSQETEDINLEI